MSRRRFDDLARRILGDQTDVNRLLQLAEHASAAEHGTMLVISSGASDEAARLASQAHLVNPVELTAEAVAAATAIDGAILVDPSGLTHALGVILDGTADDKTGGPARARGSIRHFGTYAQQRTNLRQLNRIHAASESFGSEAVPEKVGMDPFRDTRPLCQCSQ